MSGARSFDATTIFERSAPGRSAYSLPADPPAPASALAIPDSLRRSTPPGLPEVAEPTLVRHYTSLSQANHSIDTGFYPLGSCTMKYNPKLNERVAALPGFSRLHPLQADAGAQGTLAVLGYLQESLAELAGLPAVSLVPAAGAHGEMTGLLIMRAWHERAHARGETAAMPRHVLIPDTAHGTNPASVTMAGFSAVSIPTDADGGMDVDALRAAVAEHDVVGLMLTNPNTLGLFDRNIGEIADIVHAAGGLLYYDGANFNAIMGKARPGDMGFDIVHFNVHKSFSTPHGGGGPGAGPVAVRADLAELLPTPVVERDGDAWKLVRERESSIGPIGMFQGNVGVLVRAAAYIRRQGADGLEAAAERAVLNANYLRVKVAHLFGVPFDRMCAHEFVASARRWRTAQRVRALDIAKRLMDYGFHPPTVYFPLLVDEAMMIEPTETETRETLDHFVEALEHIVEEIEVEPGILTSAPHTTPVRRLDEARAVKELILRWEPGPTDAAARSDSAAPVPTA